MSKNSPFHLLLVTCALATSLVSFANSSQANKNFESKHMCNKESLLLNSSISGDKDHSTSETETGVDIEVSYRAKAAAIDRATRQSRGLRTPFPRSKPIETKVSDATTQFGINFLNSLSENANENVVLSPVSLQILLNMILLGSGDNSTTQKELSQVLGYDKTGLLGSNRLSGDRLKPHQAIKNIFDHISSATRSKIEDTYHEKSIDPSFTGKPNFNLANQVLTNKQKFTLKDDYKRDLEEYYKVNFDHFSEPEKDARSGVAPLHVRVNNWVRNITQNQIEEAVGEGDLKDPDLWMVLLNAAHFKARWLNTFYPHATSEQTFFNKGKVGKQAKFMRQKDDFDYADLSKATGGSQLAEKLDCTVLSMPFMLNGGQEFSMVFMLPTKKDGIGELQRALDQEALSGVYKALEKVYHVDVSVPKFSFNASHDARPILSRMGLNTIFGKPNLKRMAASRSDDIKVDKVLHKAKITVDEYGAEAAAVSVAKIVPLLARFSEKPPPSFVADHPFLFIIRHSPSNMPLFIGRVSNL